MPVSLGKFFDLKDHGVNVTYDHLSDFDEFTAKIGYFLDKLKY
jgi:hypothetical protein